MDSHLKAFLQRLQPVAVFVLSLWVIHCTQVATGSDWGEFGIFPQSLDGIRGIFISPLIHANWTHLASNSAPFLVTGALLLLFYPSVALRAFVMIYFFTGLTVWFFARPVYHIGASGVVYGMVSFLFWSGIFRKSSKAIFLALGILTLYSGLFAGIVPDQPNVSWESHLIGGVIGIFIAYYFKNDLEEDEVKKRVWNDVAPELRPFFLARDTFELTKMQRWQLEQERIQQEEFARQQYLWQQQQLLSQQSNPSQWYSDFT